MATNTEFMWTESLALAVSHPSAPESGGAVVCGQIPGVALIDEDTDGLTTVALNGVFRLPVKGETTTNAAVAVGDILYYDSGVVNRDASNGVRFGYALDPVDSGATTTIRVKIGY